MDAGTDTAAGPVRVIVMRFVRGALFQSGWVVFTLVLGILGLPFLVLSREMTRKISWTWARGTLCWLRLTTGIGYEIRGLEYLPASPSIVALKHQAAFETFLLNQLLRDPAVVLKRELLKIPFFGWYLQAVGMIAIERSAGAGAMKSMIAQARAALAAGRPVAIFPEGTRAAVGAKPAYHPGVAALYSQLGVPLVPVALNSGLYWGKGLFAKRPGRVVVEILPPIPSGLDRREAIRQLEISVESATAKLVAEAQDKCTAR